MIVTQKISDVVNTVRQGGVIAYPTEAVFGLGCDPRNPEAVQRLLAIKHRPVEKGLILIAANFEQLRPFLASDIAPTEQQMQPDNITWVFPASLETSVLLRGNHQSLAVRVTQHPLVQSICHSLNSPITSTSANITGEPACYSAQAVIDQFSAHQLAPDAVLEGSTSGQLNPTEIRDAISGQTLRYS